MKSSTRPLRSLGFPRQNFSVTQGELPQFLTVRFRESMRRHPTNLAAILCPPARKCVFALIETLLFYLRLLIFGSFSMVRPLPFEFSMTFLRRLPWAEAVSVF